MEDRAELIKELFALKRDIETIEQGSLKEMKTRRTEIENILKATMDVGEKAAFAGIGSVTLSEEIQPSVTDWTAFYEFVTKEQAFYMMMRKVNGAPFREALNQGLTIPGVASTTVRKLSVRKAA